MSSKLTGFVRELVRDTVIRVDGEVLSRPGLLRTDGTNLTYACDVRLLDADEELRACPIAAGVGGKLSVALDVGCAVELSRIPATGKFEITGFSKRKPGKRKIVSVNVATGAAGPIVDRTLTARPLTLGELASYGGGFGLIPFGAYAVIRGGVIVEVRG